MGAVKSQLQIWRLGLTQTLRSAIFESFAFVAVSITLAACGGGNQQPPPPPMPDFSLTVSPSSASAVIGNTTSTVTVSVVPQNGFNGSVNVTLQGLPPGVNATPGSSFTLQTGVGRALLFSVTSSAAPAAIGYSFSLDTIAYSN